MTLTFEPLISSTLWLVAAIVAASLLGWYAWNRPGGVSRFRWGTIIVFMSLGSAMLLAVLLNPTWQERIPPPPQKPRLSILIDDSASMASTDMPAGGTRYQAAAEIAEKCAARLAEGYDVEVAAFSKNMVGISPSELRSRVPGGLVTDLAGAISSGIDPGRASGQAVLLLSDGNHNAGGGTPRVLAAAALARAHEVPIFTKTFGSDAEVHDLALRPQNPQQLSFVGQSVPVSAVVRRRGRAPGPVTVVLEQAGEEVGRQSAFVAEESEVEVRFQVKQEARGLYRYEARVEPFPGEVTQVNNHSTFVLRVVDEPIRVLLVEGKPYWDSKFLARTLASDPSIELVSIVRMTGNRYLQRTMKRVRAGEKPTSPGEEADRDAEGDQPDDKAIPVMPRGLPAGVPVTETWRVVPDGAQILADARQLGTFQVLVMGRDSETFLSDEAIDNVRQWVAGDSGALVCCRGQPMARSDEKFNKLLPVQWQASRESRFRMTLTERGRDLHWFDSPGGGNGESLPSLPALATSTPGEQPKPLANVLASAAGNATVEAPAVTYQPYGGGRVVVVEGSGMWRWAFLPPAYSDHDATYGTLWQSLLRWLVSGAGLLPGQDMALRTDQVTFGSSEPSTATLLVRREAAQGPIPGVELSGDGLETPRTVVPAAAGELPGVFRINFGELPEGRYQARIAGQPADKSGASAVFDVRRLLEEQLDLKARPDLMARIASNTAAADFTSASADEIVKAFTAHLEQSRHERIKRTTAWDRWWVLAGTFFVWTCAWSVRRRGGLV
ncbi:MAG: hypothetical protein HY290_08780 [Planctomycetia bacterium]|nr:hypothetical protein [Planctomycetia bacterium]